MHELNKNSWLLRVICSIKMQCWKTKKDNAKYLIQKFRIDYMNQEVIQRRATRGRKEKTDAHINSVFAVHQMLMNSIKPYQTFYIQRMCQNFIQWRSIMVVMKLNMIVIDADFNLDPQYFACLFFKMKDQDLLTSSGLIYRAQ